MKNSIRFALTPGTDVGILAPKDSDDFGSMAFHTRPQNGVFTDFNVCFGPGSVTQLALLHRALGVILDTYCPGLTSPLPHYAFEEIEEAQSAMAKLNNEWIRINQEED